LKKRIGILIAFGMSYACLGWVLGQDGMVFADYRDIAWMGSLLERPQEDKETVVPIGIGDTILVTIDRGGMHPFDMRKTVSENGKVGVLGHHIYIEGSMSTEAAKTIEYELQDRLKDPTIRVSVEVIERIYTKEIKKKPVNLHISATERFDDNIFQTTSDRKRDFVTSVISKIKLGRLEYEGKKLDFMADLGGELLVYGNNRKYSTWNPDMKIFVGDGTVTFRCRGKRRQVNISTIVVTPEGSKESRWKLEEGVNVRKKFGRLTLMADYERRDVFYEDRMWWANNANRDALSVMGQLDISSKRQLFSGYDIYYYDYPKSNSPRRIYDTFWAGIGGKILPKLTGLGILGYARERVRAEDMKNRDTIAYRADLIYELMQNLRCIGTTSKGLGESTYIAAGGVKSTSYSIGCSYRPSFCGKLNLYSDVSYRNDLYRDGREDETYGFVLRSGYGFTDWARLTGEYKYEDRVSTRDFAGHRNNIFSIKMTVVF